MLHATMIIEDGKIKSVLPLSAKMRPPEASLVLRFTGMTVMPGLINGHGHLGMTKGNTSGPLNDTEENINHQLLQYERYGVTTVMSLGMNRHLLYELRDKQKQGATILTADRGLGTVGGAPAMTLGADQMYRPSSPEEARAAVREMAGRHADFIKIWVDDGLGRLPKQKPEVYRAAIDETHKLGLKIAAHVYYLADAKQLVRDGVDVLAHSVRDTTVDDEFIQLLKQRGTYYIPTLQLEDAFFVYADKFRWMNSAFFKNSIAQELLDYFNSADYVKNVQDDRTSPTHRHALEQAMLNLKMLTTAGVKVAFGTDSGAFPARIAGFAEHRELWLMVSTGMKPIAAIHNATAVNAEMLGIAGQVGTLEPGKYADFIVLDADPEKAIQNTTRIVGVWHRGAEVPHSNSTGVRW